jgi:Right handed beta helix region
MTRASGQRTPGRVCAVAAGLVCALLPVAGCQSSAASSDRPTAYYVSPSGNDSAAGTSAAAPWRTLARVNTAKLRPGDRVLLQGGRRFTGQLVFTKGEAGAAADPVVVGSYGSGRARISTGTGSAITVYDTAGLDIRDLVISGRPAGRPAGIGINLYSDLPGNRKLDHIVIDDTDVSHFVFGIAIGGGRAYTGFRDVWISNSTLHANLDDGLVSYAPSLDPAHPQYAHEGIYISHVHAYDNPGDPSDTAKNTGNGIVLGNVQDASITWSTADDNGGRGAASQGPVGIWAYDSADVVIAHNVSYGNRTSNLSDGDGFGLDENTEDCDLEYNISFDNSGAGYLLYAAQTKASQEGNVVRFNISSGDGRRSRYYGGITLLGEITEDSVYQNTVVMPARRVGSNPALRLVGDMHGVSVRNNIFVTTRGGPVAIAATSLRAAAAVLQGNDYYATTGAWSVTWGNSSYATLQAWRAATGQELLHRRGTGLAADPEFTGPVLALSAAGAEPGRIGSGFVLRSTSPLRGAGLSLARLFHMAPGRVDFSGADFSGLAPDVGAG